MMGFEVYRSDDLEDKKKTSFTFIYPHLMYCTNVKLWLYCVLMRLYLLMQ